MNEKATTAEIRENLARKYGLDRPLPEQYVIYLSNMIQGGFLAFLSLSKTGGSMTSSKITSPYRRRLAF